MDDPFYNPASREAVSSGMWNPFLSIPPALLVTIVLAPLLLLVVTRVRSGGTNDGNLEDEETAGAQSYWFPSISRGVSMLVFHDFSQAKGEN